MKGGRIGDEAKDQLAREIIAFANTDGGTLIIGMDEDRTTKRAIPPLWQIPRCKEAANRLHQSIGQRIENNVVADSECEEVANLCRDLLRMGLEREVARFEEMDHRTGNIAPERLGTARQEKGIVLSPDR
jgi:hypothetical protein